jgi:thiol:disulfide interchange protein DsbD
MLNFFNLGAKVKRISWLMLVILFFNICNAQEDIPKNLLNIGMQTVEIENQLYLSINLKNHPDWHTYWKNPGDAGLPLDLKFFEKDKEVKLEAMEWPIPKKFVEPGDQWAFGYGNEYSMFFKLNKFAGKNITLKAKWLICKNICVPGKLDIDFQASKDQIKTTATNLLPALDPMELKSRFINLPKVKEIPNYLDLKIARGTEEKTLVLTYEVKNTTDSFYFKNSNLIFPFAQLPFDFKHEQIHISANSITGIVPISWDGEYQTPPEPLNANGKFKKPYSLRFLINDPIARETYIIEKKFNGFDLKPIVLSVSNDANQLEKKNSSEPVTIVASSGDGSLTYYLLLAFVGGLILNIMPCVLPVISIKLFGLIKYQKESKTRILKHNIFYTLGILFSFALLASIIVVLKNVGTVVGWGFQLQSPNFIAIMVVALFIFSLNLFGLFEFSTPGGHHIGNFKIKDSFVGDFLGGVLATVLSTPCSAPFLGTALTFAFTSQSYIIFSVFLMIGIGLAFPFIITGIFPNLVSFLPKPGNWMNTLKKILGLTLFFTIIWLVDVFNTLVNGQSHLMKLMMILIFILFGFLLKKKEKWIRYTSFALGLVLFINLTNSEIMPANSNEISSLIKDKQAKGLDWKPWSYAMMDEYKTNRQVVFMDFTAKWCFTCKVNEKLVLETDAFKALVQEKNLKLLIGDWTKRDEVIGDFLMKQKLVGVPAYFIQKEDGTLINLGETISIDKIKQNL